VICKLDDIFFEITFSTEQKTVSRRDERDLLELLS
jgi:hypothetical protein